MFMTWKMSLYQGNACLYTGPAVGSKIYWTERNICLLWKIYKGRLNFLKNKLRRTYFLVFFLVISVTTLPPAPSVPPHNFVGIIFIVCFFSKSSAFKSIWRHKYAKYKWESKVPRELFNKQKIKKLKLEKTSVNRNMWKLCKLAPKFWAKGKLYIVEISK